MSRGKSRQAGAERAQLCDSRFHSQRVAQSCSAFWNYSAAFIFSQHPQSAITNVRTAE
jgi:hypothetical protein